MNQLSRLTAAPCALTECHPDQHVVRLWPPVPNAALVAWAYPHATGDFLFAGQAGIDVLTSAGSRAECCLVAQYRCGGLSRRPSGRRGIRPGAERRMRRGSRYLQSGFRAGRGC